MCDCSAMLNLYFAITAFGLEALWLITMREIIIKMPHCFDFPASTEVALLGIYTFPRGKNFAIIGACIEYLWTKYCICTMYIFIYLYNINTFHHTIFWLSVVSSIEKVAFECNFCLQLFTIVIPDNLADLITYWSSLYPRVNVHIIASFNLLKSRER